MPGVILENLSNKKLIILGVSLLICWISCFLIGGLIAPAPSNVQTVLGTKCIDTGEHTPVDKKMVTKGGRQMHRSGKAWMIPHPKNSENACKSVSLLNDPYIKDHEITANQVVFAFQIPLKKMGQDLDFSRWQQNLIGVLQVDIAYDPENPIQGPKPILTLDIRLGYRNSGDPEDEWTELATSVEERSLDCDIAEKKEEYLYNCTLLPLFELGSLHHDFYLINIRLPVHNAEPVNEGIGQLADLWLVAINQNGGFTKVWLSLKSVFFPSIVLILWWFCHRLSLLARKPVLLEKLLILLGIALTILNLPLEFLTLWFDLPGMLLVIDIRQGMFYAALLSFWLVFAGEHMMDDIERNRLTVYWKHLAAVVFGCVCLFVFDLCERGVQLKNPFYSIWVTELGTNLALGFIILAGISACLYFLFLSYMIYGVFRNITYKRISLPSMSSARRLFYEGVIYRFKFLMVTTLVCAALTVISFIVGQASEGRWKWDDSIRLEYTSAFLCGVYGMWNIYVFALIVLYAPSHKRWPSERDVNGSSGEEIEFTRLPCSEPSEGSSLTAFVKKAAAD